MAAKHWSSGHSRPRNAASRELRESAPTFELGDTWLSPPHVTLVLGTIVGLNGGAATMGMSSFSHGGARFECNGADPAALTWAWLAQAVHRPAPLRPSLPAEKPASYETPSELAMVAPAEMPRLTGMERQVIRLVSLGCSLPEMAAILGRRLPTIDNHKTRAMRKLGVHKAAELTRVAIRLGISSLEDRLTPQELQRLQATLPRLPR